MTGMIEAMSQFEIPRSSCTQASRLDDPGRLRAPGPAPRASRAASVDTACNILTVATYYLVARQHRESLPISTTSCQQPRNMGLCHLTAKRKQMREEGYVPQSA